MLSESMVFDHMNTSELSAPTASDAAQSLAGKGFADIIV